MENTISDKNTDGRNANTNEKNCLEIVDSDETRGQENIIPGQKKMESARLNTPKDEHTLIK